MLEGEVLIGKLGAVDGLATSAVVIGEVTTLAHEVGDDTVCGKRIYSVNSSGGSSVKYMCVCVL